MIKLLDFYADWCGPCQVMKPLLGEVEKDFSDKVDFMKVNVDQDQEMAAKYGVMSIPTYIIEKDGKEVDRKMGAVSKETLKDWIKGFI